MSDASHDDDAALVQRAAAGDQDAWAQLMERHAPRLAAYLGARLRRPEIVDQLVSESIYVGWRSLDEVDVHAFGAWFRGVGAILAMRWHKQHQEESLVVDFPADRCGGDDQLLTEMQHIEDALGQLSEGERIALEQRYRGGISGATLAEALHMTEQESQKVVESALGHLAQLMQQSAD